MTNPYSDIENVVDLMVKAALVDGVETSVRQGRYPGSIEIVMRRGDKRVAYLVDLSCIRVTPHYLLFEVMKSNLKKILLDVYDKIGMRGGEDG